jgi:metal-responsive CopG/Arc/MetJ family transcriptional regulator
MRMININMREDVVKQIDAVVSDFGFANRSEFIRSTLREKIEEYRTKQAIKALEKSKGALKGRNFTDEEIELARGKAFEKIVSRFK